MNYKNKNLISLLFMIIVITFLHYFTSFNHWEIHEIYRRLYYIPIIFAAFKFRLRGGLVTSIFIVLIYTPHVVLNINNTDVNFLNQILEMFLFVFIGVITGYLAEKLDIKNQLLLSQLEKISQIEMLNENILNSMSSVLIALDLNKKVKITNKAFSNKFNKSKIKIPNFFEKDLEFSSMEIDADKVINGEEIIVKGILNIDGENKKEVFKYTMYPLVNYLNKTEGIVIILENVTEILELEKEIENSSRLTSIGLIASSIAHEIRNPLGIIQTIVQTIKYNSISEKKKDEGLDIIIEEITRANKFVNELLDFSKAKKEIIFRSDLSKLIDNVVTTLNVYEKKCNIKFKVKIVDELICAIQVDKIKQVFLNILLNAINSMDKGGVIIIKGYKKDSNAVIEFVDEGKGISKKNINEIFDPFFTSGKVGTGLGLAISKKIILEHNGLIEVESEVDKGSNFKVVLPLG
ncbi:sensor histidine kinase [Helicovermis profundi]|uniref:histidine kinase n=1 Tax=Helicovermis profundi TaxID=3065157 RepID=A0AAU9E453_9FIRM|nr:hypothetical protein HLPR_10710 [Clostridia bacterium S502]